MKNVGLLVIVIVALFLCSTAHATIWYVHPDSTVNSIQDGIDLCGTGDTVLVGAGTYIENINFNGMAIMVTSEYGADTTIIDGSNPTHPDTGSVVLFISGEDTNSVIDGFTITNGTGTLYPGEGRVGGGVLCISNSSPTIENNTITSNAAAFGGGIQCIDNSSPSIVNNTISANNVSASGGAIDLWTDCSPTIDSNKINYNSAASYAGGIHCYAYCSPLIINNEITNNSAASVGGALRIGLASSPTIINNLIRGNRAWNGGGIICDGGINSSPHIVHNTITEDTASGYGGGIACEDYVTPTIDSCLISYNKGDEIYCLNGGNPVIHYNNIIDTADYGVFNSDPSVTIDAKHNWWNHDSGPYHPTANPGGQGVAVSDYVDFNPWLYSPGIEEEPIVKPVEVRNVFFATIFRGALQLPEDKKCKVFDIMGRVVEPNRIQPGIYFIEVNGMVTQKVVKIR